MMIICACGTASERMPSQMCACGRSSAERITPARLDQMRRIAARSDHPMRPPMRHTLCGLGVIRAVVEPGPRHPHRFTRHHQLTATGRLVLEAAQRLEDAERVAEQTRHDVAASVARHAEMSDEGRASRAYAMRVDDRDSDRGSK